MRTATINLGHVLSLGGMLLACSESATNTNPAHEDGGTSTESGGTLTHDGASSTDEGGSSSEGGASQTAPSACPVVDRAIPADAFLVAVADRANLQALMDAHTNVRLEAGDYSKGGPNQVQIQSGHGLFAAGKATLPAIVVPSGTSLATISGVRANLEFGAQTEAITHDNCFEHMSSSVTGNGAALLHNEFVDFYDSSLSFDTSAGGYLRNNRFIRLLLHGGGNVAIRLVGDAAYNSYGNVVFWLNALGAPLDTIDGEHQRDLTILGADGESYGTAAAGAKAMYYTRDIQSLRINTASGRVITPAFDLGADELVMFNAYTTTTGAAPRFTLQPDVARAALIASPEVTVDMAANPPLRLAGLGNLTPPVLTLAGVPLTAPPAGPLASTIHELLAPTNRAGRPWSRPVLPPIPDPAGPGWDTNLAARPDEAPMLQNLIDTQHVVQLEPRAYYLGSALKLRASDGLIGSGADKTVLIAKTTTIDLITTALPPLVPPAPAQSFGPTLIDLTLQGGKNGLNVSQPGTQMTISHLDHVTFREMSNAGILGDHVYGIDNNMFAYLNFYHCASGYKMRTGTGPADDSTPDLGYMDKTVFYRNQFVQCGTAIDVVGRRQNNLNVWFESSFRESTTTAFHSEPDAGTIVASCEFIDNHGDPVIETSVEIVNSYFRVDQNGTTLLRGSATVEGSIFERGTSTTAQLLNLTINGDRRNAPIFYMMNSRSDLPLGPVDTSEVVALLINDSLLSTDAKFGAPLVLDAYDTKGTPSVSDDMHSTYGLLPEVAATPGSQLLFEDGP